MSNLRYGRFRGFHSLLGPFSFTCALKGRLDVVDELLCFVRSQDLRVHELLPCFVVFWLKTLDDSYIFVVEPMLEIKKLDLRR